MSIRVFRAGITDSVHTAVLFAAVVILAGAALAYGAPFDQIAKFVPRGVSGGDHFGGAVAVVEDMVIIGVGQDDGRGTNSGSVYVLDINSGQQLRRLIPDDVIAGDQFGRSIATDGELILASSFFQVDSTSNTASAYIFNAHTGQQVRKLQPSGGPVDLDLVITLALKEGVALIGSYGVFDGSENSGSVYLFDATTGAQLRELVPQDGDSYRGFGASVAISGGVAIIGTVGFETYGVDQDRVGSVYLFDIATGNQIGKLLPEEDVTGAGFGTALAVSGNVALVSALRADSDGFFIGSSYLFDLTTGAQIAKLSPNDGDFSDGFGIGLAINDNIAAVGAQFHDQGELSATGAVYLFDTLTGNQIAKLVPDDVAQADRFGVGGLAFGPGVFLAGSPFDDDSGSSTGSIYLFEIPEPSSLVLLCFSSVALARRQRN